MDGNDRPPGVVDGPGPGASPPAPAAAPGLTGRDARVAEPESPTIGEPEPPESAAGEVAPAAWAVVAATGAVEPVPVGGLAEAVSRELSRPTVVGLAIGVVLALGSIPAALWLMLQAGQVPQLPVLAAAGLGGFLVALLCAVVLPPFLLPSRSRRALAAFMWIGAVEIRRQLGGTSRALAFPSSPEAVPAWILANPETAENLAVHVEVRVFAGDFGGAREVLGRLPAGTPVERFRRADLAGLIDYQQRSDSSFAAAREALAALPPGRDRVEAEASFAVTQARLRSSDGDWREPLLAVRPSIPESDFVILLRDHGWPPLRYLLIRVWLPVAALLVAIALLVQFGPRLG